jgi:hypothetical protein
MPQSRDRNLKLGHYRVSRQASELQGANPCVFRGRVTIRIAWGGFLMRFLFLTLAFLMFFVWVGAFVVFHVAAFFIHILLVLALIFLVIHLVRGRRAA